MDMELNYEECGSGFPMILLHGNGEDHTYFKHQINYFSDNYRVIAIDTRGHGNTPRGTASFSLNQFVEDLKYFLDNHNIIKIILLGFSDGANIAILFTLKYPQYVNKLILNGANLFPGGVKTRYQIPIKIVYKLTSNVKKKELYGLMVNEPNIKIEELQKINIPTLVIAADKDMIKTKHTLLIHNNIKGSTLVILKGTHFIANKNFEEFNKAVRRFLMQ